MVFSSIVFLFLFLPVVLFVHALVPRALRNAYLLVVSLVFYAWGEGFFVLVMLASVLANWLFGLGMSKASSRQSAKRWVVAAVVLNLGLLFTYKYANFAVDNLNALLQQLDLPAVPLGHVHLPLGISFFTFQALSYVIDVYRGRVQPEQKFVHVALYIALFPQLIAGPIVRFKDIAAQLTARTLGAADLACGIRRFLIGLGKKVLIANTIGEAVDQIHGIPHGYMPASVAWMGGALYMLQLYFDFSGYSDMAIGLGRMFGFRLLENFNYPYVSKTLTEFWQRWHISLSTWFRDYLFAPLGSYRRGRTRAYVNLMIVFFLCGFWHGATWNMVLFGVAQGGVMIVERLIRAKKMKFFSGITGSVYLLLIIHLTFILFRCNTMSDVWWFYRAMFGAVAVPEPVYHVGMYLRSDTVLATVLGLIGSGPVFPRVVKRVDAWIRGQDGAPIRLACAELGRQVAMVSFSLAVLLLCSMKLAASTHNPFIYFRF